MMKIKKETINKDLIARAISGLDTCRDFYNSLGGSKNQVIVRILSLPEEKRNGAIFEAMGMDVSHCADAQQEMMAEALNDLMRAAHKATAGLIGPNYDDPNVNVF